MTVYPPDVVVFPQDIVKFNVVQNRISNKAVLNNVKMINTASIWLGL